MITFAGPNRAISLPSPRLGDRIKLNLNTVYKRMMDASVVSYIKGPVIQTFELEFEYLNRPKVVEFIRFLGINAGQSIIYTDYNNRTWKGRIINFPSEAVHVAPRNNNVQIVFEGVSVA